MIIAKKQPLDYISEYLPEIYSRIEKMGGGIDKRIQEIRLREGQFVTLELGEPMDRIRLDFKTTSIDMEEYLRRVCHYSIHSFGNQIAEGFVTIRGGHRVGFSGTAVINKGVVENIRDITSMNIRVAREYFDSSAQIFDRIIRRIDNIKGLLIIGRPMSAKTTVLRDLTRNISGFYKVSVIDERGEIAAKSEGKIHFDLGANTDVLDGFPKAKGFITALRALSPDFIVCDEIGFDYEELQACVNSGVRLLLTAHAAGIDELESSRAKGIIKSGGISHVALLGAGGEIGRLKGFWEVVVKNEHIEYIECGIDNLPRDRRGII